MKKLPERLQVIADCIKNGANVADIGTDHGMLPVYLAKTGIANRIIASDISEGSLAAARSLVIKHDLIEKIEIVHAPGLDSLTSCDVDTIIIAGVGGETIISVLSDAPWVIDAVLDGKMLLILQPQTKYDLLCKYLTDCGLSIKEEKSVLDRGREYKILLL